MKIKRNVMVLAAGILLVFMLGLAASALFSDKAAVSSSAKAGNVSIEVDGSLMDDYLQNRFPFEAAE